MAARNPNAARKTPLTQKGRKGANKPWFFAVRFALLIVNWDNYRLPVAFRPIRPKTHPQYRKENDLFRDMVKSFVPPRWAHTIVVEGDAGYGSQDNMNMVIERDQTDTECRWGFVFAIAQTWKTAEDKAIKDLVTHLPKTHYQRTWVPGLPGTKRRKTYWLYSKRLCLRHVGGVTVVVSCYQRRWPVEQINRELKSDLGLGQHQVSGHEERIEKSFGIAMMAYLFLLRACHEEIVPGQSWSIPQLQHAFRLRVITNQVAHNVKTELARTRKAA